MRKALIIATGIVLSFGTAVAQTTQGVGGRTDDANQSRSGVPGKDTNFPAGGHAGTGIRNLEGRTGTTGETLTSKTTKKDGTPLNDNRGSQPAP